MGNIVKYAFIALIVLFLIPVALSALQDHDEGSSREALAVPSMDATPPADPPTAAQDGGVIKKTPAQPTAPAAPGAGIDDQVIDATAILTAAAAPGSTPVSAASPAPASPPSAVSSGIAVTAADSANLRSGPGTEFEIAGGVQAGETLVAVGRHSDGTWLLLDGDIWIAAFLVTGPIDNLPVVSVRTGPQPTATQDLPIVPTAAPAALTDVAAIQEYAAKMLSYKTVYDGVFEDLAARSIEATESPWLILDESWRAEVAASFTPILLANDEVRQVTPPAILADVHAQFLEAAEHIDRAVEHYSSGIENLDLDQIGSGNAELEAGSLSFQKAMSLLQALIQ